MGWLTKKMKVLVACVDMDVFVDFDPEREHLQNGATITFWQKCLGTDQEAETSVYTRICGTLHNLPHRKFWFGQISCTSTSILQDGVETDTELYLATEPALPLVEWLAKLDTEQGDKQAQQENAKILGVYRVYICSDKWCLAFPTATRTISPFISH